MRSFVDPDPDEVHPVPPFIEVEITDPEVIGEILGPKGEVLARVVDRSVVPFGFRR